MLSVCANGLWVVVGALVFVAGLSKRKSLDRVNRLCVELLRAIPPLVLMAWVFYGLPVIVGRQLWVPATSVLSMAISDRAIAAEVLRAGIQSVPKGEVEAARSPGAGVVADLAAGWVPEYPVYRTERRMATSH